MNSRCPTHIRLQSRESMHIIMLMLYVQYVHADAVVRVLYVRRWIFNAPASNEFVKLLLTVYNPVSKIYIIHQIDLLVLFN